MCTGYGHESRIIKTKLYLTIFGSDAKLSIIGNARITWNGVKALNKKRITIGIILIFISVAAMVFWETKGRNEILLDEVVVFAKGVAKDSKLEKQHLSKGRVLKESRVEGSVDWLDLDDVVGKYLTTDMGKKAQLSYEFLRENPISIGKDQSIFLIPGSWIEMKSSALRRGDLVEIFETRELTGLGTFKVAFVKDSSGAEVVDEFISEKSGALERWKGSAPVDHVEIIGNLQDYERISEKVVSEGALLLLVQREVF